EGVGHSAGVFDEEKLAWVNRHYLKVADQARIAELALEFFNADGVTMAPSADGLAFLAGVMPIATGSVDRLRDIPARLSFLFEFDPARALEDDHIAAEMRNPAARAVVGALAEVLAGAPRLDREQFRAAANQVKATTGQKGKALFHPIRI